METNAHLGVVVNAALQHLEFSNHMAIYHLSVKPVSRRQGRSAPAAAAYRAGNLGLPIRDLRTGIVHDYSRKKGVDYVCTVFPDVEPKWANTPEKLWNAAELAERRKDACTAREVEVAIPVELDQESRRILVIWFAIEMAKAERCAVDLAVHCPPRDGDKRNFHAHLLRTTREILPEGFGRKLASERAGRSRKNDLRNLRELWAKLANSALAKAGFGSTVDHRSLRAQGILNRKPTFHLGRAATATDRKFENTGRDEDTRIRIRLNSLIFENTSAETKRQVDEARAKLAEDLKKKAERNTRDEFRRAAFDRIREYGKATDETLRVAKQHAEITRRDTGRVAEACSAFRTAHRDRQFVAGIGEQIGPATKKRLIILRLGAAILWRKLEQSLISGPAARSRKRMGIP